jgi:hypothetical protein
MASARRSVPPADIGAFEFQTLDGVNASLSLNPTTVNAGTSLVGTVTLSNQGGAQPVDVYVPLAVPPASGPALGCPAADAVAFLTAGGSP